MLKQTLFRTLVLLSLLGLLSLAVFPPQGALAGALLQTNRNRATLCGRLVFLEDFKTQARLIGLIPCNENRPLIFAMRPGELFDFYHLTNVVIKKGDKVQTLAYGTLENYITRFDSFKQIGSCRECDSDAPGAQPPSAASTTRCTGWVLDQVAAAFPVLNDHQALDELQQNLQAYAGGPVINQTCGVDNACRTGALAQQLGVQLGPLLSWNGLGVELVIDWLTGLLADPATVEACPSLENDAPRLVAGLNQQGYAIDLGSISPGCDLLARDLQGQVAGFETGSAIEQIPGARAVASSTGQFLLLPTGSTAKFNFACTASAYVSLQLVQRDPTGIRQYVFSRMPVRDQTRGEIDLAASPLVLSLDPRGDGATQERKPDRSLLHPALVAPIPSPAPTSTAAPPTATAFATSTPEATPTTAPATAPPATALPTSTVTQTQPPAPTPFPSSGPAGLCPLAIGAMLLPGWAALLKTLSRRHN